MMTTTSTLAQIGIGVATGDAQKIADLTGKY